MPFVFRLFRFSTVLFASALSIAAEESPAQMQLDRALHFADLYNWADAAPAFADAERMFSQTGDHRNALYARLGRIRSNIERKQRPLPVVSAELGEELKTNPLLRDDKRLRMFCLIVKGDLDTETRTADMREDWEQVRALARDLGDAKWEYRALAQLGLAAFYDGDTQTALMNAGKALAAAKKAGDIGTQIRYFTAVGVGMNESKIYDQALVYFGQAIQIANSTPDTGYQFAAQEGRLTALIGLRKFDAARKLADEIMARARQAGRTAHEITVLSLQAVLEQSRDDYPAALATCEKTAALAESAGLLRILGAAQSMMADIHRRQGDLAEAERIAQVAAASIQQSGDAWAVPTYLHTLAGLQIARAKYVDASDTFDRAEAFVDALIGKASTVIEKTAFIRASSDIYADHFALIADRFNDPRKAYSIIEQVRGRISTDLLRAGSITSPSARRTEQVVSRLRLKLMTTRSTAEIQQLRDQIFLAEQSRWIAPGVNILKAHSGEVTSLPDLQRALPVSAVVLEYVVAAPRSYCLVITWNGSRIVPIPGKARIDELVSGYMRAVKAKQAAHAEGRALYDALLRPVVELRQRREVIVVRDGQLHLIPFDGLVDEAGKYLVESKNVVYAPSATSFYLLNQQKWQGRAHPGALLAVGGVPYSQSSLNKVGLASGYDPRGFADLPSSTDEVKAAQAATQDPHSLILLGMEATETAFKRAELDHYLTIHLAVHGVTNSTFPDRAALVLLSDPSAGEDGFLQSAEVVLLRLNADLVILSACDTAVGPLEGQEGVATLSRAFLLAGARTVVSTLWSVDDDSSLYLMRRLYRYVSVGSSPASALATAKRDFLQKFGVKAVPYHWAGFMIEGGADRTFFDPHNNAIHHGSQLKSSLRDFQIN